MSRRALLAAIALALAGAPARAHEMRPSYLELSPRAGGEVDVTWSVAFARGAPMPLRLALPERCRATSAVRTTTGRTARTERWTVDCGPEGLAGAVIRVDGLAETGTDVLVRVAGGATFVLRPDAPAHRVPEGGAGAVAYLPLGVEHILLGPDHLLFVLGLLLLVEGRLRALLATITAFTLAHSVTLALATLGLVSFPTRAVEAIIALSILLLAWEIVARRSAPAAARPSLATRRPWLFALACGLLHGLGFAGALSEVGLPAGEVPAALFFFNVGVELGQLAFVAVAALLLRVAVRAPLRPALAYGMGGVAAYWLIARAAPIVVSLT